MSLSFGQVIDVTGLNVGFAGNVSRVGERVITARKVNSSAAYTLGFGEAAVLVPDAVGGTYRSVKDFVAASSANIGLVYKYFAGMAVRNVKTMLTYGYGITAGTNQIGYYSASEMAEVLERGSGTVVLATYGSTPAQGNQVYTRIVANSAVTAGTVGDWEVQPVASDIVSTATAITEGSTSATVTSATNLQQYQLVSGPGVADGTYVASISGTTVTLSQAATATLTASLLTFSNLYAVPGAVARTGYVDSLNNFEVTFKSRVNA